MAEPKKVSASGAKGKTYYNASIVKGIVSIAVSEVAGVSISTKGKKSAKFSDAIKLKFGEKGITVDVSVNVCTGYNVPDIALSIQQNIKQSVESMSEYKIFAVNVNVDSVIFTDDEIVD